MGFDKQEQIFLASLLVGLALGLSKNQNGVRSHASGAPLIFFFIPTMGKNIFCL